MWLVLGKLGPFVQLWPFPYAVDVMTLPFEDVQSRLPLLSLSLSRVGVTNVEKVIRIVNNGAEQLFLAVDGGGAVQTGRKQLFGAVVARSG